MWKFKNKIAKTSVAQQLVEFLLIAPFIIIIFGIFTEFAYALSINMNLNQGLREATSSIYGKIEPDMTADDINTLVTAQLTASLADNNIPVNNLNVAYATVGNDAFFLATYTYTPAFTLPNMYIHILPDTFNFRTVSVVPSAFLQTNNYSGTTSPELDKFWAGSINFSNLDNFNSSKKGMLKASVNSSNGYPIGNIAFLVDPAAGAYDCLDWKGSISGAIPAITTNIFVSNASNSATWTNGCDPNAALAVTTQKCNLKEVLSMTTALGSQGNFDNISIASNPLFSAVSNYKVDTYGSRVFVHPTSTSVTSLINQLGLFESSSFNGFGTKVAAP
jgi:hypothetical protein